MTDFDIVQQSYDNEVLWALLLRGEKGGVPHHATLDQIRRLVHQDVLAVDRLRSGGNYEPVDAETLQVNDVQQEGNDYYTVEATDGTMDY